MKEFKTLTPKEIEKQLQELGTSTEEVNKKRAEYFSEAERFAKELGYSSLAEVPSNHDVFESHMEKFTLS